MTYGEHSKGKLIAEVRYGTSQHVRATKIGKYWWFRIRLGKKSMVTCDCGGAVKDNRDKHKEWVGCSHIEALYRGDVTTEDKQDTGAYRVTYVPSIGTLAVHFVRMTKLGRGMFYHRWTAKALG